MTINPPFNRQAANSVDSYVAATNYVQAIAEATKLPKLSYGTAAGAKSTPQASSVSWAFWLARQAHYSIESTLVLVALAQHAAAALHSGDGYSHTTAEDVAALTGLQPRLVRRLMEPRGDIWPHVSILSDLDGNVLGWRIPEDAFNGNWLDRAARQAHYG